MCIRDRVKVSHISDPENIVNAITPQPKNGLRPNFTQTLPIAGRWSIYLWKVIGSKIKVSQSWPRKSCERRNSWTNARISTKLYRSITYNRFTIRLSYWRLLGQRSRSATVMTQKNCERHNSWTNERISTKLYTNITYSWPTIYLGLPLEGHRVKGQGQPVMTHKILWAP